MRAVGRAMSRACGLPERHLSPTGRGCAPAPSVAFWIAGNTAELLAEGLKSKYHVYLSVQLGHDSGMSVPAGAAAP